MKYSVLTTEQSTGWQASLDIAVDCREGRTVLGHCLHQGPLRLQRPFYPDGGNTCHLYMLHPPGGMVTGDALNVCMHSSRNTQCLVTTPSAGKIYRGDGGARNQYQQVDLHVEEGAFLEWLPQETIVFDGARGELNTEVHLQPGANLVLWDIVCLGRPASDERFENGYLVQNLLVKRWNDNCGETLLYRERNRFAGGAPLLEASWGMGGQPVTGTLIATCDLDSATYEHLQQDVAGIGDGMLAVSCFEGLLMARYLGSSAEECKSGFDVIRQLVCPHVSGHPALRPRIWNT